MVNKNLSSIIKPTKKQCKQCGKDYIAKKLGRVYCGKECTIKALRGFSYSKKFRG